MAIGVPLKLSDTTPDFESLVLQLQLYLDSKGTWSDVLTSSLGQTLIEMMAAVGAFNQFAIESAAREDFLSTAKRQSSVFAITRMLGVRMTRKYPASTSIRLTRTLQLDTQLLIPRFTQFTINGQMFFNRDAISFGPGIDTLNRVLHTREDGSSFYTDDVFLYEGVVKKQTFAADTTAFREIYLDELNFIVSDHDIRVRVINTPLAISEEWTMTRSGNAIWTADPYEKVFYDSTSGYGDTIISFGDNRRGAVPTLGSDIEITYAQTLGAAGNIGLTNYEVKCIDIPDLAGATLSIISGGSDEKSAMFYKSMAPYIYKAHSRAVTRQDYQAIALNYPGIASVSTTAQRDSSVRSQTPQWMNVVQMCLLPDKPTQVSGITGTDDYVLSDAKKTEFLAYMQEFQHVAIYIELKDAYRQLVDLELTVFLKQDSIPANILPIVYNNIRALFTRDFTTLGRKIATSDVVTAATYVDGVDYVDINVMQFSDSIDAVSNSPTVGDLLPLDPTVPSFEPLTIRIASAFLELNDTETTFKIHAQYSERIA